MNKISLFSFLFLVTSFFSCQGVSQKSNKMENEKYLHTNKLIKSSSPYLLQHAHNPVDWYPWGNEALEKAKKENKLLIISIGYSSCHWCHVMEKETFEDDSVAKLMNEHFISIKVDREERPDIDDIYMNAAHMITGRGGWPLNIIATADQKPVYTGTYFPKKQWIALLSKVTQYKKENKGGLEDMGEKIVQKLKEGNLVTPSGLNQANQKQYEKWIDLVKNTRDYSYGGSLGAPKFPMPIVLEMLFNEYLRKKDEKLEGYLRNSLYQMSNGGIYDHVGGCFSRYSTDEHWKIPHFEKMLYDNAQLIYIYAKGYNLLKEERFKKVVEESVQFMFDEMQSSDGFFYSAYDADSEGVEGKYYVWTIAQLNFLKQEEQDFLMKYMNVSESGNWEHSNILYISPEKQELFENTKIQKQWIKIRKKLKKERAKRIKPLLDDKAITAWNMLLFKNLVLCGQLLDRKDWIQKAEKQMEVFLNKTLDETKNTARLKRIYKDGKVTIGAFLDDYAIMIDALITLYQADLDTKWLLQAKRLLEYVNKEFSHEDNIYYYFTEKNAEQLIHRKLEFSDNVIPSSNAFMASNLLILGNLLYNKEWVSRAKKMVSQLSESIEKGTPSFYAKWVILYENFLNPPYEVAVVGNDAVEVLAKLSRKLPKSVILFGALKESDTKEMKLLDNKWVKGKTMIYVCQNKVCKYPTEDIEKAISLMK